MEASRTGEIYIIGVFGQVVHLSNLIKQPLGVSIVSLELNLSLFTNLSYNLQGKQIESMNLALLLFMKDTQVDLLPSQNICQCILIRA